MKGKTKIGIELSKTEMLVIGAEVEIIDNISELLLGITHWMPIPSFDEILEANKDVLERIKEKGD